MANNEGRNIFNRFFGSKAPRKTETAKEPIDDSLTRVAQRSRENPFFSEVVSAISSLRERRSALGRQMAETTDNRTVLRLYVEARDLFKESCETVNRFATVGSIPTRGTQETQEAANNNVVAFRQKGESAKATRDVQSYEMDADLEAVLENETKANSMFTIERERRMYMARGALRAREEDMPVYSQEQIPEPSRRAMLTALHMLCHDMEVHKMTLTSDFHADADERLVALRQLTLQWSQPGGSPGALIAGVRYALANLVDQYCPSRSDARTALDAYHTEVYLQIPEVRDFVKKGNSIIHSVSTTFLRNQVNFSTPEGTALLKAVDAIDMAASTVVRCVEEVLPLSEATRHLEAAGRALITAARAYDDAGIGGQMILLAKRCEKERLDLLAEAKRIMA